MTVVRGIMLERYSHGVDVLRLLERGKGVSVSIKSFTPSLLHRVELVVIVCPRRTRAQYIHGRGRSSSAGFPACNLERGACGFEAAAEKLPSRRIKIGCCLRSSCQ